MMAAKKGRAAQLALLDDYMSGKPTEFKVRGYLLAYQTPSLSLSQFVSSHNDSSCNPSCQPRPAGMSCGLHALLWMLQFPRHLFARMYMTSSRVMPY